MQSPVKQFDLSQSTKINKYLLIVVLYFFFNSVFLPHGLLYTSILTPVFYHWTFRRGQRYLLELYLLMFLPFTIIHLWVGVDLLTFIISNALLFTVYVFTFTAHTFFNQYDRLEYIFNRLLILNFGFTLIALLLFFTPLYEILWHVNPITRGVGEYPRLKLLTYEPSYYSTLLVPLAGFFGLQILLNKPTKYKGWAGIMIVLPLLLSFSFGVISCLLISLGILLMMNMRELLFDKKIFNWIAGTMIAILILLLLVYLFYPENILYRRLYNIFTGEDPSAKGRLIDSFWLAWELGSMKNIWFGTGAGQLKVIGDEYIIEYYNYNPENFPVVRLPNAFAETIVTFGIVGGALRLILEIYLFVKTRVYNNYFRTLMFFFVFIYQFTGSFLTNVAEYVLWALAFSYCLPQFNRQKHESR